LYTELENAHVVCSQAQTVLQTTLSQAGFDNPEIEQALLDYDRRRQQQLELTSEEATLERLRSEAQTIERDIQDWQDKQQTLSQIGVDLCALFTQAGVACTAESLDAALVRFNEGVENHQQWVKAKAAHEAAVKNLSALLKQQDATVLKTTRNDIDTRLNALRTEHPDWNALEVDKSPQYYAQQQKQTEENLFSARQELNRLQDGIKRMAESLRHPAEIDEEITAVKAEIHDLECFGEALKLASIELSYANEEFQSQFAPKLEGLMREGLSRITDGRYTHAQVDPTSLAVSLVAPELDGIVDVERLSTGTRDLVYLILRMSIARLMSSTGERLPLLLDDPLVQCDRARQERAVDFLVQAARETQVFLFTKDEEVLARIEQVRGDSASCKVHQLI
jgi:DNA repair exonuclease SbcCD ATPase subunit